MTSRSSSLVFDETRSVSESGTSCAESGHEQPRKRRRLLAESSVALPTSHIISRIKPSANTANLRSSANIEQAIISNGKVVDARSSFATLDVAPWLIASLSAMEILRPTAIQKGCIPQILEGADVIGGSRTGSGKTIAFAVPILQKWAEDPIGIFALVLTPTR